MKIFALRTWQSDAAPGRDESPIGVAAQGRGHVLPRRGGGRGRQFRNLSCVIHESAVAAWCKCLWVTIRFCRELHPLADDATPE